MKNDANRISWAATLLLLAGSAAVYQSSPWQPEPAPPQPEKRPSLPQTSLTLSRFSALRADIREEKEERAERRAFALYRFRKSEKP